MVLPDLFTVTYRRHYTILDFYPGLSGSVGHLPREETQEFMYLSSAEELERPPLTTAYPGPD